MTRLLFWLSQNSSYSIIKKREIPPNLQIQQTSTFVFASLRILSALLSSSNIFPSSSSIKHQSFSIPSFIHLSSSRNSPSSCSSSSQTNLTPNKTTIVDTSAISNSTMRPKPSQTLNLKLIILGVLVALLLIFVLRSDFSSSNSDLSNPSSHTAVAKASSSDEKEKSETRDCSVVCNKIPASLAQALIHYTTSTITPQQTLKEISVTARVLEKKSPCNFLVFGLGHDSLMWSSLNHGGKTLFLEEDEAWIEQIKHRFPMLESYHVTYESKVNEADNLMEIGRGRECKEVVDPRDSKCQISLKGLPSEVYETKWDLIMVDAPTGYHEDAPGRMTAIYTAGLMARNRDRGETHVFVHDVNREVEDRFSKEFLCEKYMRKQEGRLRHFIIPSHIDDLDRPFCPL